MNINTTHSTHYPSLLSDHDIKLINRMLIDASLTVAKIYYEYVTDNTDIGIEKKADASPVTHADMLLHKLISSQLAKITPDIFCLSEESDDSANLKNISTLWMLDPVDGTRAFIGKTGEFTINLALIHCQKVVASWLVVPMQGELYCCFNDVYTGSLYQINCPYGMSFSHMLPKTYERVLLAKTDSVKLHNSLTVMPTQTQALNDYYECTQINPLAEPLKVGLSRSAEMADYQPFLEKLTTQFSCKVEVVQASSAYKFIQMLRNEIDVYVRAYPTYEWDTAAGQGFLEFIGGGLINFRGNPFLYNSRQTLKNGGFVCFKNTKDKNKILNACKYLVEED